MLTLKNLFFVFIIFFIITIFPLFQICSAKEQTDFLKYINNDHSDYQNVLVLGVGADWNAADVQELVQRTHFDLIIPLSNGNKIIDSLKATVAKLGVSSTTIGKFDDIKGKKVRNLYAHSWGSSETINFLSVNESTKVGSLHCMGSPESAAFNYALNSSLKKGNINKVYFHINEDDLITWMNILPKLTTLGGFSSRIEFHYYLTEKHPINTNNKEPATIPIFNVSLGFTKYFHYNCPEKGHGFLWNYLENLNFVYNQDPKYSVFSGRQTLPFLISPPVQAYFVSPSPEYPGKSINEAKTLTEMNINRKRAIIAGIGPEADFMYKEMVIKLGEKNVKRIASFSNIQTLQIESIKFGADVILGVRNPKGSEFSQTADLKKNNGVDMSPNPIKAGKGGAEIKHKVINSRPAKDSLTWEIK